MRRSAESSLVIGVRRRWSNPRQRGRSCDTPVCINGCHEDAQCGLDQVCQRVECVTCPCPRLCALSSPMGTIFRTELRGTRCCVA